MVKTFRETYASIKNPAYGQTVITKSVRQAFFYWLKYILILSLIPFIFSIFALTYFVPQLPKLARENLPTDTFEIQNGHLVTTQVQPINTKYNGFDIKISPDYTKSELSNVSSGVLITSDTVYLKNGSGNTNSFPLSTFNGLKISRDSVSGWLEKNSVKIFILGLLISAVIIQITSLLFAVFRLVLLLVWSAAVVVIAKATHQSVTFNSALKIAFYAAVPALIGSTLIQFLPSDIAQFASMADLVIFILFAYLWTKSTLTKPTPEITPISPTPQISPKRKRTSKK